MIKTIVSDFSRVLLFPKDKNYRGSLNSLHKELSVTNSYNPLDHFELNTELLFLYASLKEKTPIYIFTSDSIQDAPEFQPLLKPIFTKILSAKVLNLDKKQMSAYTKIAELLGLKPDEVLYIDDSVENIEAAKSAGLDTLLYQDFESTKNTLGKILYD